MSRATYYTAITLFCLLLPASVAVPYLFYGEGFKILKWAWVEGYLPFWVSFCFSAAMGLICFVLLVRLQHMGRILFTVTTVISILASAVIAMVEQRHLSLVVVIFFLACILVYASEWIRKALDLPYFRSHRAWWEARPKGVPGVSARILYTRGKKQQSHPVRVVNFGKEGCFVFFENAAFAIDPQSIEFDYGEGSALCLKVDPVIRTSDRMGVGLRFLRSNDSDEHQDLQDYLVHLRRSGYVSE